jgi:hypothetical protein
MLMPPLSHAEFRSSQFPAYPGEDEKINPGRHGLRLAEYLRQQFRAHGIPTAEPELEDWGVRLPVTDPALPVWVGCGNYEEYPDGFLCFVEPSKPAILRLFARAATARATARVAEVLGSILASNPEIREVRWWKGSSPE